MLLLKVSMCATFRPGKEIAYDTGKVSPFSEKH